MLTSSRDVSSGSIDGFTSERGKALHMKSRDSFMCRRDSSEWFERSCEKKRGDVCLKSDEVLC